MPANAKSLRLREMIAKPLIPLGFAKSRAKTPTSLRQFLIHDFLSNFARTDESTILSAYVMRNDDLLGDFINPG